MSPKTGPVLGNSFPFLFGRKGPLPFHVMEFRKLFFSPLWIIGGVFVSVLFAAREILCCFRATIEK